MEQKTSLEISFLEAKRELFTVEEVAKWCNMSRKALYQHYRRGHIKPEILRCHRLYFSREAVADFINNYRPVL